jgi:hypothetical protein
MSTGTSIERFRSGSRRNGETNVESTEHPTYTREGATAIVTMNLEIGWPIFSTKDATGGQKAFQKSPARFSRQ